MRRCQLCGACSWGPLSPSERSPFLEELQRDSAGVFVFNYMHYFRCDCCKSIARKDVIDEPQQQEDAIAAAPLPGDRFLEAIKEQLPVPQTRTERLVRSILQSQPCLTLEPGSKEALNIVQLACCIEHELDSAAALKAGVFLTRRFLDRETFEEWMVQGLDHVRERVRKEGVPADFNISRVAKIAKYFADWVVK